jgi:hypothetical protein
MIRLSLPSIQKAIQNVMFYAMQLYFCQWRGPCYVVSTGGYDTSNAAKNDVYKSALDAIGRRRPTLLVFLTLLI